MANIDPTLVSAVIGAYGTGQATVSWTAPVSGAPLNYTVLVQNMLGIGNGLSFPVPGTQTSLTINGLSSSGGIRFVVLTNLGGNSLPSQVYYIPDGNVKTSVPVSNLNTWAGSGQAFIYCDAPAGILPSFYEVSSTPITTPQIFSAASQITPWVFTGLTNGTAYTFTVTPIYNLSSPGISATSNSITPQVQPVAIASTRNPLALWLSADKIVNNAGTSQPANSAGIATWLDASGNGTSVPSASSAATTMLTSWTNGKSAVAMSGVSSGFLPANFTTTFIGSAFTVFIVMQSTLSGNTQFIASVDAATGVAKNGFNLDNNGTAVRAWSSENVFIPSATAIANTPFILEATFPGQLYINGTKQSTANYFLTAIAKNTYPWQIGNNPKFGLNMIGDIGSVLVYKGVLSGVDRQTVRQALGAYYNISVVTAGGDLAVPGVPV